MTTQTTTAAARPEPTPRHRADGPAVTAESAYPGRHNALAWLASPELEAVINRHRHLLNQDPRHRLTLVKPPRATRSATDVLTTAALAGAR